MQAAWEIFITAFAYGVIYPALFHPIETTVVLCGLTGLAIWRA